MSVARVTEIKSSSTVSFDDAIREGIARVTKTLKNAKLNELWWELRSKAGVTEIPAHKAYRPCVRALQTTSPWTWLAWILGLYIGWRVLRRLRTR